MTSTGSVSKIQTPYWTRALRCLTYGSAEKAKGPKVSSTPFLFFKTDSYARLVVNTLCVQPQRTELCKKTTVHITGKKSFHVTTLVFGLVFLWSLVLFIVSPSCHLFFFSLSVESLYTALRNIDRADIVTSLEGPAPQPGPGSSEEGACRLVDRDSSMLSPSVINGKTHNLNYLYLRNELLFKKKTQYHWYKHVLTIGHVILF